MILRTGALDWDIKMEIKYKNSGDKHKGFTLIELMVVVVIIGVVSAFSVPNYFKSIEREREKATIRNLTLIHRAQTLYEARNPPQDDEVWPYDKDYPEVYTTDQINDSLNLNIIEDDFTYRCGKTNITNKFWFCQAEREPNGYIINMRDQFGEVFICCPNADCPTLTQSCGI